MTGVNLHAVPFCSIWPWLICCFRSVLFSRLEATASKRLSVCIGDTVWSGGKTILVMKSTLWLDFTGFQRTHTNAPTFPRFTTIPGYHQAVPPPPPYVIEPGSTVREVDVYSITLLERRTTVAGSSRFARRGC